jgi:uncharacterized protein
LIKNITEKIPTQAQCYELMSRYSMLPNIIAHSRQVMNVCLAITDHLKEGLSIDRDTIIAAALLHDITKIKSIKTKERHDASGGALLRELGFPSIAGIVEQHVIIQNLNFEGSLEEREIVYYADKRVMHDKIVSIDERIDDLIKRYGTTEEIRNRIFQNTELVLALERKISGFMEMDIDHAILEIV